MQGNYSQLMRLKLKGKGDFLEVFDNNDESRMIMFVSLS